MAIRTKNQLEASSSQIRDETINSANSATRIGVFMFDLVQTIFSNLFIKVDKVIGKQLSTNDYDDAAVALINSKVEQSDIDTAIALLKAGVPAAGDNLLKLHNLIVGLQNLVSSNDLDYDTLQEVVDFIKLIDTEGEMLATMDAAVGNADWRAAYEVPLGNPDVNGKVLSSTVAGVRSWVLLPTGGVGSSFSTQTINHAADGILTIDFSLGNFVTINLTANVNSIALTTPADGNYQILFVQDAVGGRIVNFVGFKTIDGVIPDYSVEASVESLIDVTRANTSTYVFGAGNMTVVA